jgi:hypothetical protein
MPTVNNRGLLFGDSASGSNSGGATRPVRKGSAACAGLAGARTERLLAALRRSVLFDALKVGLRLGNKAKGLYQQQVEHHGANQDERTEGSVTELP